MSEKLPIKEEGCCDPECGPSTCGSVKRSKHKPKMFIAGVLAFGVIILSGYFIKTNLHHNSGKLASAEIVLQDGVSLDVPQIAEALADRGFQLVKMEKSSSGNLLCVVSGLRGECCVQGVESGIKDISGVKNVTVSY